MEDNKSLEIKPQEISVAKKVFMDLSVKDAMNGLMTLYSETRNDVDKIQARNDETSKAIISFYEDSFELFRTGLLDENLSDTLKEWFYDDYVNLREVTQQYLLDRDKCEIREKEEQIKVKNFVIKSISFPISLAVVGAVGLSIMKTFNKVRKY